MNTKGYGDFWVKLDGAHGPFDTEQAPETYAGAVLLGFGRSNMAKDGKPLDGYGTGFKMALEESKYVGAFGIRMFKTHEETMTAYKALRASSAPATEQ